MNLFALPFMMSFTPLVFLGVAVLLQHPKGYLNRLLCAFCLGNALVVGSGGMLHLAQTQAQAAYWNTWPYLLNTGTFWLFMQYAVTISGGKARLQDRFLFIPVRVHYWFTVGVLALVAYLLAFTDLIMGPPVFHPLTGWEHGYGPWHSGPVIGNFYLLALFGFILYRGVKAADNPIQHRSRIISLIALVSSMSWVLLVGLIFPAWVGWPTHSFAALGWLALAFLLSYGLMRQQWETIQDFRFRLEEKVARRTAELAQAKREMEEAQTHISKYLDPHVVEKIFAGQFSAELTSRRAKLTMFFSDIKDFTQFTDGADPEEVARLLNEYLGEMAEIVRRWGGTIPQFTGDAIYAIFGAPDSKGDKQDALAAVRMGLDMQESMQFLRDKWWNQGIQFPFQIRCGIHTGMANVGNYGSEGFMEFSAIGLNVNLASRLEQVCEPGQIYISHATWAQVKDEIACQEVGTIEVKGFHHPIQTYRVLGELAGLEGQSAPLSSA